jgi:hypothetical protein
VALALLAPGGTAVAKRSRLSPRPPTTLGNGRGHRSTPAKRPATLARTGIDLPLEGLAAAMLIAAGAALRTPSPVPHQRLGGH